MWSIPPRPPAPETLDVVDVTEALLTPFERGPLRTDAGPTRWVRGAVHDEQGALVLASQRLWIGNPTEPVAADPVRVDLPRRGRRLDGTWIYAGHWSGHFGHFLLETLPVLWPEPGAHEVTGVVAHRQVRGRVPGRPQEVRPTAWQRRLVELAGYAGPVRLVQERPLRVERLVVPERPVVLKGWVHDRAVEAWQRVSAAVGGGTAGGRVFLSRTRFHAEAEERTRADAAWDRTLDETFAAAGFAVVHPETLPIDEQVALVRRADVIAGPSGSALHLSAFAGAETRVLSIGDQRTPSRPGRTQMILDAAGGRATAHVDYLDADGLEAALASLDPR